MAILRNLFGSLASGVIRLAVAGGILLLCYLFIVRPVLNTTDNAINSANKTFEKSFGTKLNLGDVGKTIEDVNAKVQAEIKRSFHAAKRQGRPAKLIRCIRRAHRDVDRIQRCTRRF